MNFNIYFSFSIPFYWFLYLGWALLIVSIIAGLYYRKVNTYHLFFAASVNWHESSIELNKSRGHKIDNEEEKIFDQRKKNERKYFLISNLTMKFTEYAFVIGMILIISFVVLLTNSLMK